MAASVRLRRAQIAFAFKLFAPISRYEIFFIYISTHLRIAFPWLQIGGKKNKLKVAQL